MEKFTVHRGLVAPMDRANVDTDAIIPKQFLTSILRTGFGPNLFDAWRYTDTGQPGMDNSKRPLNKDFVLNQERYQGASVLLARRNFGCGSSREHAPWALQEYGFRAIIAPSFADIFYNNCFKNGVLPIALSEEAVDRLFMECQSFMGFELVVDLEKKTVGTIDNTIVHPFDVDDARRNSLLNGLDEIGQTLSKADAIRAYEEKRLAEQPWLAQSLSS
jgi:3-isopropylmalate/(R)-2-methylmalate dehydratase small subunit